MRIGGIDPGKHMCAWAIGIDSEITTVRYMDPKDVQLLYVVDELWCEVPVVYKNGKADPNDIVAVGIGLGQMISRFKYAKRVDRHPRQWKGNVDGDMFCERIWDAMLPEERKLVDALGIKSKKKRTNPVDACGLVLHAVGRL